LVLIFLLSLAFLALGILAEVERRQETIQPADGSCPTCARPAEADWLLCPHCRTLLKESCSGCGGHVSAWYAFCPDCGIQRRAEER
jgi:predicted amidophosphoribosyltransferase